MNDTAQLIDALPEAIAGNGCGIIYFITNNRSQDRRMTAIGLHQLREVQQSR
jgi:hypothetical protein